MKYLIIYFHIFVISFLNLFCQEIENIGIKGSKYMIVDNCSNEIKLLDKNWINIKNFNLSIYSDSKGKFVVAATDSVIMDEKGVIISGNNKRNSSYLMNYKYFFQHPKKKNIICLLEQSELKFKKIIYSEIDLEKNDGKPEIIFSSDTLFSDIISIVPIIHSNNNDIWFVAIDTNMRLKSYLMDEKGVYYKSQYDNIIFTNRKIVEDSTSYGRRIQYNYLKVSPDGKRIVCMTDSITLELIEFNNKSGNFSNIIKFESLFRAFRTEGDLSFSPDGNKLYLSYATENSWDKPIFQFDLSNWDSLSIINSKYKITSSLTPSFQFTIFNQLILGANSQDKNIVYLENPNDKGDKLIIKKQPFFGVSSYFNIKNHFFHNYELNYIKRPGTICLGDTVNFEISSFMSDYDRSIARNVKWRFKNGKIINSNKAFLSNFNYSDTGWYYLYADLPDYSVFDSIYVRLDNNYKIPTVTKTPNQKVCFGTKVKLNVNEDFVKYIWSTGDTSKSIEVIAPGNYYVDCFYSTCCSNRYMINLDSQEKLDIKILGKSDYCIGDTIELKCDKELKSYFWSNGEKGASIKIANPGKYWLRGIDSNACIGFSDTLNINFHPKPKIKIKGLKSLCSNSETEYFSDLFTNTDYYWTVENGEILYQNNEKCKVKWNNKNGVIKLLAINRISQCNLIDSIEVIKNNEIKTSIKCSSKGICQGSSVTLSLDDKYKNYLWNNGSKDSSIVITKPGNYWVEIESFDGCRGISDTVNINEYSMPVINLSGNMSICLGDSTAISVDNDFTKILWSNNSIGKTSKFGKPGIYKVIVVDSNGCVAEKTFEITSVNKLDLSLTPQIEFNDTYIGFIDSLLVEIRNNGEDAIISELNFIHNNKFELKAEKEIPINLSKGEKVNVWIYYYTNDLNIARDTIIIISNNLCGKIIVPAFGIANALPETKLKLFIPDTSALIGDINFKIPIFMENSKKIEPLNFSMDIEWFSDVFWYNNISNNILVNKVSKNDSTKLQLKFLTNSMEAGLHKIAEISGLPLLSKHKSSIFKISNINSNAQTMLIETVDGKLTTNGVCVQDLRPIQIIKLPRFSVLEQPVEDILKIKLDDTLELFVEIFDVNGRIIKQINLTEGINNIDVSQIPVGLYLIRSSNTSIIFIKNN